jgi:hypothetical protein
MFAASKLVSFCPKGLYINRSYGTNLFKTGTPGVQIGRNNFRISNFLKSRWLSVGVTASPGVPPVVPPPAEAGPSPPKEEAPAPKKLTFKEKTTFYFRNLYKDYRDVYFDTIADAKARPGKAGFYLCLLGGVIYCIWTAPNEQHYFQSFVESRESLDLVAPGIRNPDSEAFVNEVSKLWMKGLLRHQSLGLFSIVWRHNEDPALGLYSAQCEYLKPLYSEMWDRLVDVGIGGRWLILEKKMVEYDINYKEWDGGKSGDASSNIASMLTPKKNIA